MVLDGKAVRLILDPCDQLEPLRVGVNRQLDIPKIESPGPVVVILDHSADRDRQPQLPQNILRDVHLPASAIHHDQIREHREAAEFRIHSLFLQLCCLLKPVYEPSGQNLLQRGIVIRPLHCPDPELPVIARLRHPLLKDNHRADRFHPACVGDIVRLDPADVADPKQRSNLLHGADRASLLLSDPLAVLPEDDLRVFPGHRNQLFLGASKRNPDVDRPAFPLTHPLFKERPVADLRLQHHLGRKHHVSGIELTDKI